MRLENPNKRLPECIALWCYKSLYLVVVEHPMPGPQPGTGRPEVADAWLLNACFGVEETEAAATPPTTTERTKTRIASFIISYPLQKFLVERICYLQLLW
jgi:hypothetical protein